VAEPADCQRVLEERQAAIDGDEEEKELVRDAFVKTLKEKGYRADTANVWIGSSDVARIVNEATGETRRPTNRTTAYLSTLGISELRRRNDGEWGRGFSWLGVKAPADSVCQKLFQ
jgi:hypothetical protein